MEVKKKIIFCNILVYESLNFNIYIYKKKTFFRWPKSIGNVKNSSLAVNF